MQHSVVGRSAVQQASNCLLAAFVAAIRNILHLTKAKQLLNWRTNNILFCLGEVVTGVESN